MRAAPAARRAPWTLGALGRGMRLVGTAVLACAAAMWAAPAGATPLAPSSGPTSPVAPTSSAAVTGHLLDLATSPRKISPWVASDLTALESAASVTGSVSVAQAPGNVLVVAARTTASHVEVFTSSAGAKAWTSGDVTVLGTAPLASGAPAVVVDPSGVTRVFFRSSAGHLVEVENDRTASDPWFSSDLTTLTSSTGGATVAGDPAVLSAPGYATAVYARSTTGALVSFTLTVDPSHPWYYVDVSALAIGPTIMGVPVAVPAPDGFGLTAVYAVSATGDLVEFTNDDAGWHLWSARDVSTTLHLPAVASSPTALPGLPTVVATVTTTGHLVAVSIPTVSLVGASFQDLSGLATRKVEPGRVASVTSGRTGYVVAALTAASHLVVFHVASTAATTASYDDVTMQPLTEQFVSTDPVAVDAAGTVHVFSASAGYIGLVPRIVLAAESQDQFHAKIEDTPPGSNCNPFTASFGRGSTSGCAPGTAAEQWCSDFAQWVWLSSGIDTTGITGASKTFVTWGRAHHQFLQGIKTMPQVGDAVVWGVLNPLWGAHVGIVVAVTGNKIDVVSGNSGDLPVASSVWRSGLFTPSSQTAQGDPIIGFVSPVALPAPKVVAHSSWPRGAGWPITQGTGTGTGTGTAG